MANFPSQPQAQPQARAAKAAARWPNFYEMLKVAPDVDVDTLRARIRESYMEATANTDHRDLARRIHYQTMVERIVPQARHILLDPKIRADYDRQLQLHASNSPQALEYIDFLREIPGSSAFGVNPTSAVRTSTEPKVTETALEAATRQADAFSDDAPTFWSDIAMREESADDADNSPVEDSPIEANGSTVEFDRTHQQPPSAFSSTFDDLPVETQTPQSAATPPVEAAPVRKTVATTPIPVETFPVQPQPMAPEAAPAVEAKKPVGAPIPVAPPAAPDDGIVRAKTVSAAEAAALADSTSTVLTPEAMRGARVRGKSPHRRESEGKPRFLSHTVQMLLAAIAAAGFTLFILRSNGAPTKIPLRIVYAPGLETVMRAERARFAQTPAGASIDLVMQPLDGRAAMQTALSPGFAADLWIPAEALWSEQFNAVAASKGAKPLTQTRSLALSPSVLLARSDRSAALRRRFPNRIIGSWAALREAVIADGAGHFGLGDPVRSGSGAVVRYFMAKEWSERNGRELTSQTAGDAALWRWLSGFEDNVPVSERISSDMVKDLALGTGNRYWWAVALESEAISHIKAGRKLEIFYLPQTNYAQHPLCAWDRGGANSAQMSGARAAFDALLRSPETQQNLLRNGYRPTDLELAAPIKGNPFTDANLRARGLRREGFRVVERIPYRTLNALNNGWKERFS